MRSRSQRVAKSFSLSLSLSLSLGGSNFFFEGKNASGKDFNVSTGRKESYESLNNEFYRSKLPEDA
jgi:hypothetical protein